MRPVSTTFTKALRGSHVLASRVSAVTVGQNGVNPAKAFTFQVESGSVTLDSTAQIRATLDLTVVGPWPTSSTDYLAPYGAYELFVERGIKYGAGSAEWVSQGYYRINDPNQQSAPDGSVEVAATDRMASIIDARIPSPLTYAAGSTIISVIQALVLDVMPWAVFDYDAGLAVATLASAQTTTDDRYGFLNDLITAQGMVWYWDYRGILYIHSAPSITGAPVATVESGHNGSLVALSRELSRTGVYNGCAASGQQASDTIPPVYALVVDNNPTSPTYWGGPFGKVPQFYSSSFLTTTAQCISAATSIMQSSLGLPYSVNWGQVPNPALEPYDVINIRYPLTDNLHRVTEKHVIKQLVIPLDAKTAMTGQTRQQLVGAVFS